MGSDGKLKLPCVTCGEPSDDWCPVCLEVHCSRVTCRLMHARDFNDNCHLPNKEIRCG